MSCGSEWRRRSSSAGTSTTERPTRRRCSSILLGELHRWGLFPDEVRRLLPHADRALEWIEVYGDRDGDGFVEYQRSTDRGLFNQGWKDSGDGITFADGRIAQPPIALCEVQGYVYAAYLARALLAEDQGEPADAMYWRDRAARLKLAFNEQFWLPDRGWYALGLDRDKRPIDSLASNMGHCLWTGIVDDDKAEAVAERLLSPEMFTGWGVRTLASSMAAYNPMSYHNGSVWPHDNGLIVGGLMRYGFVEHAQRVAMGILDAAAAFSHQLPELICGFDRTVYSAPGPVPDGVRPPGVGLGNPALPAPRPDRSRAVHSPRGPCARSGITGRTGLSAGQGRFGRQHAGNTRDSRWTLARRRPSGRDRGRHRSPAVSLEGARSRAGRSDTARGHDASIGTERCARVRETASRRHGRPAMVRRSPAQVRGHRGGPGRPGRGTDRPGPRGHAHRRG